MSLTRIKQRPVRLWDGDKRDVRTQFGALCWRRRNDEVQVLLITSRRRKRWILPKGWPVDMETPAGAAKSEAWEEAGVEGTARPVCLGIYSYTKELPEDEQLPCVVAVFPIKVKNLRNDWPEKGERRRKWVSRKKAAMMIEEPELAAIVAGFDPSLI